MRLLVTLMVWQRPEIAACAYQSLAELKLPEGWDMDVLVVGSEGEASCEPAERCGFRYVEFPNSPLGAKANHRLTVARELPWDCLMTWASDAVATPGLLSLYAGNLADRVELEDRWHVETRTGEVYYFPGHKSRPDNVGIGRMVSREAIERCGWKLWNDDQECALDREMDRRLAAAGYPAETVIRTQGTGEAALELKSGVQITDTEALNAKSERVPEPPEKIASLLSRYKGVLA